VGVALLGLMLCGCAAVYRVDDVVQLEKVYEQLRLAK
jgi:hypothetical protein